MAKITFVLVFLIALAIPLRSVLGQGGWQDLVGGGDFAATFDQAKKAIDAASGAAAGQAAINDYFGGDEEGETDNEGASLAGWLDSEG